MPVTSTGAEQTEATRQSMQDEKNAMARELAEARAEIERLTREADGQFVKAAIRVMQANPGFNARDYAEDGITADDFEEFFTEDMNEAWRCREREKARADAAEAEVRIWRIYAADHGLQGVADNIRSALRKAGAL